MRNHRRSLLRLMGSPAIPLASGYRSRQRIQLDCGHTICEGCTISGGPRVVCCGLCGVRTDLKTVSRLDLPRNTYVLGRAAAARAFLIPEQFTNMCVHAPNYCYTMEHTAPSCDICLETVAYAMCHDCSRLFCENCWFTVHAAGQMPEVHSQVSVNIADLRNFRSCVIHPDKAVEHYCADCNAYICSFCQLLDHEGENHRITSVREQNTQVFGRLREIRREVEDNLERLEHVIRVSRAFFNDCSTIENSATLMSRVSAEDLLIMMVTIKHTTRLLGRPNHDSRGRFSFEELTSNFRDILQEVGNHLPIDRHTNNLGRRPPHPDLGFVPKTGDDNDIRPVSLSQGMINSGSSRPMRIHSYSSQPLVKIPVARTYGSIAEGCSYGVHLSYVKDPGEFYVIRSVMLPEHQKLENLIPSLIERCEPAPYHVFKDELYFVECPLEKKWYRGKVLEILTARTPFDEPTILVQNVDYGDIQVTKQNRMRQMPTFVQEEPPMALKCRLSECIPKHGTWCNESRNIMLQIIRERMLTMFVVRVLPDVLEVDLFQKNTGSRMFEGEIISLRDSMVYMEYCSLEQGAHPCDITKSVATRYPFFFAPRVNSTFTGVITHVVSETTFFMQMVGRDTDDLMEIMDRMNTFYDANNQKGYIYNPIIGMPCVAMCNEDYLWYRAKIVEIPEDEKIRVQFVDYGFEETLNYKLVRKIKADYMALPAQAFMCTVKDLIDPKDPDWRLDPKAALQKMCEDVYQARVVARKHGMLEVILQLDDCCLRDPPAQPNYRQKIGDLRPYVRVRPSMANGKESLFGSRPFRIGKDKLLALAEMCDNMYRRAREQRDQNPFLKNLRNMHPAQGPEGGQMTTAEDGVKIEVKIVNVVTPSEIYLSIVAFRERLEEMDNALQEFFMYDQSRRITPWQIGDNCICRSITHQKWLRGNIESIPATDTYRVNFYDIYGSEDIVAENMRNMHKYFAAYPVGVIKCYLDGISSPDLEWSQIATELLTDELKKHDTIYMTKRGKIENRHSFPVKLWVKTETENATEGHSDETWCFLGNILVSQKAAVEIPNTTHDKIHELDEGDFRIGLVRPPTPEVPQPIEDGSRKYVWGKPIFSSSKHFIGEPTHVDDDGTIYMHNSYQDDIFMEVIQITLCSFYYDSEEEPRDYIWDVNEICVAKHTDNRWYRGQILKIQENNMYEVLYVDFGDTGICCRGDLRKSVMFNNIPPFALKYKLCGVTPMTDNEQWTPEIIDKVYDIIVEKKCSVTIFGKDSDFCDRICIAVGDDGPDLAAHLVDLGIVKYDAELNLVYDFYGNPYNEHADYSEFFAAVAQKIEPNATYKSLNIPEQDISIPIKVTVVRAYDLSVTVAVDDLLDPEMKKVVKEGEALQETIQNFAVHERPMNSMVKGVACLVLSLNDNKWYRAEVDHIDKRKKAVGVNYVDFGYREYVTKNRIRFMPSDWFEIPKMALNCRLRAVKKHPDVIKKDFYVKLNECLSQPGLVADITGKRGSHYIVDIRRAGSSELAYQNLIDAGILQYTDGDIFDGIEIEEFLDQLQEYVDEEVQKISQNQNNDELQQANENDDIDENEDIDEDDDDNEEDIDDDDEDAIEYKYADEGPAGRAGHDIPDECEIPEESGQPEALEQPEEPGQPEEREEREEPGQPENREEREEPGQPENLEEPEGQKPEGREKTAEESED